MIAEIIVNSNAKEINKTFDYIIPENIKEDIDIGSRVYIPFGKQKLQEGFVVNIKEKSEYANKEIIEVKDNLLNNDNIELAKLMARRYFCNIADCIKLMLPPGNKTLNSKTKEKQEEYVHLANNINLETIKSKKQLQVIDYLKEETEITISDLKKNTGISTDIIRRLEKNGVIKCEKKQIERNPFINKKIKKDSKRELTSEQKVAYEKIINSQFKEILIYGITGSRKNRSLFAVN